MTQTDLLGTTLSIAAGLLIELFFQSIKYRDSFNTEPPRPMTAYTGLVDASNYISVSQYLSGGHRKWFNYFLFRLLPPFIIFMLFSGILDRYTTIKSHLIYLVLAAIISLLFRDIKMVFKAHLISEKLLHIINIFLVLLVAFGVYYAASKISFSVLAPSINGLIDNMWSSLFAGLLVIVYLKATNMSTKHDDVAAENIAISNYVVNSYTEIKKKYSDAIEAACAKYACSKQVLYAVLVYENMNRPAWMRTLENLTVRLLNLRLTVGIAQVRSNKPLSDEASIEKAAKLLKDSIYAEKDQGYGLIDIVQLQAILEPYNDDPRYTDSVSLIISNLRIYANELLGAER